LLLDLGMVGQTSTGIDCYSSGDLVYNLDGSRTWTTPEAIIGSGWTAEIIQVTYNPDPFISAALVFTNTSGVTANFSIATLATSSDTIANPVIYGASDFDLADITFNASNAVLTNSTATGDALYNAVINGTDVRDLLASTTISAAFPNTANASDSYSNELSPSIAAGDFFGIRHEFRLTPGDRITINSTFFIIPEPASLGLFSLLCIPLVTRRLRWNAN
jgi:hypothetical protein